MLLFTLILLIIGTFLVGFYVAVRYFCKRFTNTLDTLSQIFLLVGEGCLIIAVIVLFVTYLTGNY